MSRALRLAVFAAAALALIGCSLGALDELPHFGAYPGPYGDVVNDIGVSARHLTNMVSLVNYDIRGLDTLGEEFILYVSVSGVVLLLRGPRGDAASARPVKILHRRREGRNEAITLLGRAAAPLAAVYGISIVLHAQITPGGGFQGGVILFAALLLAYLGEGYASWRKLSRSWALDLIEAAGVGLYLGGGFIAIGYGAPYLTNVLPLGRTGSIVSGGIIPIVNFGVALAVAGGLGSIALEYLEETRVAAKKDK
jgi:multicomponent Na+:H+ antiporter subunit B